MEGQPNFRQWLANNKLERFHDGFLEHGFESISDFIACNEADLRELADALNLKLGYRSRLLGAVKNIPNSSINTPKTVVMHEEESVALEKLDILREQAKKTLEEIVAKSEEIASSSRESQRQITAVFEQLNSMIAKRKNVLVAELVSETNSKQQSLKVKRSSVEDSINEMDVVEKECKYILETTPYTRAATRKQKIQQNVAKVEQKANTFCELELPSKMCFVAEKAPVMEALQGFGLILGLKNPVPPEITSIYAGANSVQVSWKPQNSYSEGFEISLDVSDEKTRSVDYRIRREFGADHTKAVLKVDPETSYSIKIRSRTAVGCGQYSTERKFETESGIEYRSAKYQHS